MAAMYSKSASEGSSICGVERSGVVRPSHWYKRKFVLPSSQETPEEPVWMGVELQRRGKRGCRGEKEWVKSVNAQKDAATLLRDKERRRRGERDI